ncbi:putative siroheme synthase [Lyophyllum shimeji]|uniref:precorrin-2 dehydrogenase n=1 Tax=Lyophyllum shimeji TaxID=47721 RepID=A0A9P3UKT6_LYOSH|nr:putative siroheme synthase [Lyophyllum shimeji]
MAKAVGGGSLLIAWQLKDKHVLIVGGGEVASQRIDSILTTDAHLTVLSPHDGLHPRTKRFIDEYTERITYNDRLFAGPEDLEGMDMVLTALDDVDISREICDMCRNARIPVNAADIPDSCDFYFGSQIRDGPLQIMISTNGNGPRMANLVKKKLQNALSGVEGPAITKVGQLREMLKIRAPGVGGELGKKRMKWMTDVCNTWGMEELALLDDMVMQKLLDDGWENDRVPSFAELGGRRQPADRTTPPTLSPAIGSTIGFFAGIVCTVIVLARRK